MTVWKTYKAGESYENNSIKSFKLKALHKQLTYVSINNEGYFIK